MKKRCNRISLLLIFFMSLVIVAGYSSADTKPSANAAAATTSPNNAASPKVNALYIEVSKLSGQAAIDFFKSLKGRGLTDQQILEFFIKIPLSPANAEIARLYKDDGFEVYSKTYPVGPTYNHFVWKNGQGTNIVGPYSQWNLRLPFTSYMSLPKGPIGDPKKTYNIGVAFPGLTASWITNLSDAVRWEADRHPNVILDIQDTQYDNNKTANIIDTFVAGKKDAILLWPAVEAPTGPPVRRAIEAGIPVVTVDRIAGYDKTTIQVAGNFPANGAQAAMYYLSQLDKEGNLNSNLVLLRKPLGSTADAIRTGFFLKILSYVPGIKVVGNYHDTSDRATAFKNAQAAIQANPVIDAVFVNGDYQNIVMLEALKLANRLDSRAGGRRVILLTVDDSKEALNNVKEGLFACDTPYTPMISDLALRALLMKLAGQNLPQNIMTPDIPMVTKDGAPVFGMKTQTVDEWYKYSFGPPVK